MPADNLTKGDMVRVRGAAGNPSREATFLDYVYGSTAYVGNTKYARVCWFDVDPAQMSACSRRVLVKNITPLGKKHPSFELAHKWSNKAKDQ